MRACVCVCVCVNKCAHVCKYHIRINRNKYIAELQRTDAQKLRANSVTGAVFSHLTRNGFLSFPSF